ncbi:hypothetical protein CAPTEDRAFT_217225 [Capitella teleta]|uniref:Endonuclease/exonuclease/phosphatase domain-containing protein n=1 Tax=Capitella teleta TaxID=283909 RepID=R7TVW5_CAPTE|nr:hypothetical protein CAPTEDRAFT_217225 [Capitella teleta]|eukprot:ELT97829.1 hypothetical protein CAPTEDRAFT_217225 [Capitella teleta]
MREGDGSTTCKHLCDPVLAYISMSLKKNTKEMIKRAALSHFSSKMLEAAKKVLWGVPSAELVVERLSILEEEMKEIKNGIFPNCLATRPKGEQQPQSKLQRLVQPPQNPASHSERRSRSVTRALQVQRDFSESSTCKSHVQEQGDNPLSKTSHYTNMAEMVSGYNDEPFKEPRRKQRTKRNKEGTADAQASGGASQENCLMGGSETICIQLTNVNPKVTEANINDHVTLQGIDVCKETWLYDFELYKLSVNSSFRMNLIGKSGMDPEVIQCGRPSGGLAIITKESSKLSLSRIACSDEYEEVLAEIESIVDMQSHIDNVLVAEDLNTDISRDNSAHTPLLLNFCNRRNLQPCVQLNVNRVDFTYENEATGAKSTLDHFIFNLSLCDSLIDYFCSHDGDNMSDHAPIFLTLDVPSSSKTCDRVSVSKGVSWNRATDTDILAYKETLRCGRPTYVQLPRPC